MEIHKPHPIHSWLDLLKEVGIIVLGVLIALGAEQSVAALRELHAADEARQNVLAELKFNLEFIRDRVNNEPCIDRRLDELAALLGRARDGALDPAPIWIGRPSNRPRPQRTMAVRHRKRPVQPLRSCRARQIRRHVQPPGPGL